MLHVISYNYWCSWDSPKIFLHTSRQHICLQILSAANNFSGSPLSSPYQISKVKLFMPVAWHTFEVIIWLITIISMGYLIFSQYTFNMCNVLCQRICQISKYYREADLKSFFFSGWWVSWQKWWVSRPRTVGKLMVPKKKRVLLPLCLNDTTFVEEVASFVNDVII